jgi:hypothetical protein
MYSYEDRIRAVELNIKLGKRVKATIRQSGYPTKNALKVWYREHERRGDLAKGFHRAPKYSMAQQQAAVDHFLHHGRCIDFTRKALGYPYRSVLRSWIYERPSAPSTHSGITSACCSTPSHPPNAETTSRRLDT